MKNKIILVAEAELEDKVVREYCEKLDRRLQTLNDRTKKHTQEIMMLEKKFKELEIK